MSDTPEEVLREGAPPPEEETSPEASPPPEAGAPEGAGPDAEGDEVQSDLDELVRTAAERDEYLALAQRTQADFDNYRKRMARDVAAAEGRGIARMTRELLPALDNLERALAAAEGEAGPLADGIRLLQGDLLEALGRLGVQAFHPAGEEFDPNLHEAMAQQPADGVQAGTVVEVYQSGYRLGETVVRPARVVVAG